jgi:hypothetical protein
MLKTPLVLKEFKLKRQEGVFMTGKGLDSS